MASIYTIDNSCSSRRWRTSLLAIILTVFIAIAANADIYRSTDSQGNTLFSDQKPSIDAEAEPTPAAINAYSPPMPVKKIPKQPQTGSSATSAGAAYLDTQKNKSASATAKASEGLDAAENTVDTSWTEAQCQQRYGHSCERIVHWRKYALAACGSDPRCSDEQYLARKYQPVTRERLQQVARSAAIRNNRQDDEISEFLRRKYTNYCNHQSTMSCKHNNQCQQSVLDACSDPRSLEQLFAHYQGLTPVEKQDIITRAKALSVDGGNNSASYQQRLGDLLSLLMKQALLGI